MRRTIEYHASRRHDSEPTSYRIALPYVVFVVSTYGEQIESLSTYFRTAPLRSLDDQLCSSTLPNTNDDGIVCLGSVRVAGCHGRRTGGRADRRVLGESLQPGPAAPSAAVQRWLPLLGVSLAARSARRPVTDLRPLLADPPPGRGPDGRGGTDGPARGSRRSPRKRPRPMSGRRNRPRPKEMTPMRSLPDVVGRMPISGIDRISEPVGTASSGTPTRRTRSAGSKRRPWRSRWPSFGHPVGSCARSWSASDRGPADSSSSSTACRPRRGRELDVPDPPRRLAGSQRHPALPAFVVAHDGLYLRKQSLLGLSQTKVDGVEHLPAESRNSSSTRCRRSPRTS